VAAVSAVLSARPDLVALAPRDLRPHATPVPRTAEGVI
jgi:hypothetical protein